MAVNGTAAATVVQGQGPSGTAKAAAGATPMDARPPPDPDGKKLAVAGSAGRDRDMTVMVGGALGEGHALVAAVAQQIALETQLGQPGQHRCGAGTIVGVGRCQLKIEPRAILIADGTQLDAFDQLAAIDAACPAGRRRAQRAAVHDDRRWQSVVAAGNAPVEGRSLPEPAPQPQPGPAGKRAVKGGERDTGISAMISAFSGASEPFLELYPRRSGYRETTSRT